MGLSIHHWTPPWPSCRHQRQRLSTSPSCRVNNCNSACRTGTGVTDRLHSTIQCTRPTLLYRPKDLDREKTAWRHHRGRHQELSLSRVRKHRNNRPILAFQATRMVVSSSTLLQRISTFNMEVLAMPVPRRSCSTRISTPKAYHSACKRCLRPHSHPPYRILAPRHHLPIRTRAAVLIPLKTAVEHTFRPCRTVLGRTSILHLHLAQPMQARKEVQPLNILSFPRTLSSNSNSNSNNV